MNDTHEIYKTLLWGICEGLADHDMTVNPFRSQFVRFWKQRGGGVFLKVANGTVMVWGWMDLDDVWSCSIEDPSVIDKAMFELLHRGVKVKYE